MPKALYSVMDESHCWQRLQDNNFGRLIISTPDGVEVYPMNYAVSTNTIMLPTAHDRKLTLLSDTPVTFEVDDYFHLTKTGWSVVVHGPAEVLPADSLHQSVSFTYLANQVSWRSLPHATWIRITPNKITGRELTQDLGV